MGGHSEYSQCSPKFPRLCSEEFTVSSNEVTPVRSAVPVTSRYRGWERVGGGGRGWEG